MVIRKKHSSRGVSLTEVMVAVVVLIILAAIIIAVSGQVRSSALNAVCLTNLRQTAQVAMIYVYEHDGYQPPLRIEPMGMWYDHLHEYIGRKPGRDGRLTINPQTGYYYVEEVASTPFWCPEDHPQLWGYKEQVYSFGINRVVGLDTSGIGNHYVKFGWGTMDGKTYMLSDLSQTAWFADARGTSFSYTTVNTKNFLDFRHNGRANVVFMDGRAESIRDPGFSKNPGLAQSNEWRRFFGAPE